MPLPDELAARLTVEATRRGISVAELAARLLTDRLDAPAGDGTALDAFLGVGASGRREPFDIHQARAELAARRG